MRVLVILNLIALLGDQVYSCEKHIASAREMRYDCYSMISCPLCESIKVEEQRKHIKRNYARPRRDK